MNKKPIQRQRRAVVSKVCFSAKNKEEKKRNWSVLNARTATHERRFVYIHFSHLVYQILLLVLFVYMQICEFVKLIVIFIYSHILIILLGCFLENVFINQNNKKSTDSKINLFYSNQE